MQPMFVTAFMFLALATPTSSANLRSEAKMMDLSDIASPDDVSTIEEALAEASTEEAPKKVQQIATLKSSEAPAKVQAKAVPAEKKVKSATMQRAQASVTDVILKNGGKMNAADFESAISDLFKIGELGLTKEEFDATPFGASVANLTAEVEDKMMPEVRHGHTSDQDELNRLLSEVDACKTTKNGQFDNAKPQLDSYNEWEPKHVSCRSAEAGIHTNKNACRDEEADKLTVKNLKCEEFAIIMKKYEDTKANTVIVKKLASEDDETYLSRISSTFCGHRCRVEGEGCESGEGGFGEEGFLDEFLKAKNGCADATKDYENKVKECDDLDAQLATKKDTCNNEQDKMDFAACQYAIKIKDSCEEYIECYEGTEEALKIAMDTVATNEEDRKVEWEGLKRMLCIIKTFADGKVTAEDIEACKDEDHEESISWFIITYPVIPDKEVCEVPKMYPSTAEYKAANFATLPLLAKGKDPVECTGVKEISTTPASGSPDTCQCERITVNGAYEAGPIVKCVNCLDVKKSTEKNSCPDGTKLISPRSQQDWETFFNSAEELRAPNFLVDITSEKMDCDQCKAQAMNSQNTDVAGDWKTSDGSAWWLRSTMYADAGDKYQADCYLDVFKPHEDEQVTFEATEAGSCAYHAKSYYCQLIEVSTTPKDGSPEGCLCEVVELAGEYSAKTMLKCTGCLDVHKSTQKNSCPRGTKIFAPSSRTDWKTFLASATPLRSPDFIIDVTRPQDGCGGCAGEPMNAGSSTQATWGTSDEAPWWLRSTTHDLSSDYEANCYMNVLDFAGNEDNIGFESNKCKVHSDSYYCQVALAPIPKREYVPPPSCDPLMPTKPILMKRNDKFMEWNYGLRDANGADSQEWYLRKCSGSTYEECLGKASAWLDTEDQIKTGDVISWVSKSSGRVYDCAGNPCSQQAYPPPSGHWGTPFQIHKEGVEAGQEVCLGDQVYFYGMHGTSWKPDHVISCDDSGCGGSRGGSVPADNLFTVEDAEA